MKRFPFHLLLSLLLVLPLAACDSNEDDNGGGNGDLGEFSATFGGDLSGTFSGNAFFSVVENPDLPSDRSFVLVMTDSDITATPQNPTELIGIVRSGDRPDEGEYPIDDPEEDSAEGFAIYFHLTGEVSGTSLIGTSGSFTITSSSSDRVEGTFAFSGTVSDSSDPEAQGSGSISGSFEAVFVGSDTVPDFPL